MFTKNRLKIIARNILFIVGLIFLFLCLSILFQRKYAYKQYGSFFDKPKDYDVLFFGTSHMMNGIYPMELWDEYGMTAYNLGVPNSQIASSYWILQNALDYANPKLVVLDVSTIGKNQRLENEESLHKIMDTFPLTATKWKAIEDLFLVDDRDERSAGRATRKIEFFCDFLLYHNRWSEMTWDDIVAEKDTQKGGCFYADLAKDVEFTLIDRNEVNDEETIGKEYLRKFIEECQERDIEVLLIYLPSSINEDIQREVNSVDAIAEQYGVKFLNFMYVDGLVKYPVDFHDLSQTGGHLNVSGARKVTSYLGDYLMQNFDLTDHRGQEQYDDWNQDYIDYLNTKYTKISDRKELIHYLNFLADRKLEVYLYIKKDSQVLTDANVMAMIQNLSVGDMITDLPEGGDFLLYVNNKEKTWHIEENYAKDALVPTLVLESDGKNLFYGEWESLEDAPNLQVVVRDATLHNIVNRSKWKQNDIEYKRLK